MQLGLPAAVVDRPQTSLRLVGMAFIFVLAVSAGLNAQEEAAHSPGFAVVELFTSQGCSSCPPADQNLRQIAEQAQKSGQQIYTLSFHVDYWNDIGWEDPFSSQLVTTRQREYAAVFRSPRVYTPQMVVNGTTEFVGSQRQKSAVAIRDAVRRRATATIDISAVLIHDKVLVKWATTGHRDEDIVVLALVQNSAHRDVTAGENANRTLRHVNVVRDFQVADVTRNETPLTLSVPDGFAPKDFHVVAFIQARRTAEITAADRSEISAE